MTIGVFTFIWLIFVLNPIQALSALIYPFHKPTCRRLNRWCARSCWGSWVLLAERYNGSSLRFTGDEIPPRENALLVSNHQTMADVMVLICFAWRCRRIADCKWFVKDIVKYFPGPGWGMKFLDCVFLKRDWTRDRAGVMQLFEKYKREQIPLFLISFLEGTRRTPSKLQDAQTYAGMHGKRIPQHTLVPRTKGFVATMLGLRDHLDAVYDITIRYPDPIPTLANALGATIDDVEIHVRRVPIAELPEEEDALAQWAFDAFEAKDEMLHEAEEVGHLPGEPILGEVRVRDWFRSETRPFD